VYRNEFQSYEGRSLDFYNEYFYEDKYIYIIVIRKNFENKLRRTEYTRLGKFAYVFYNFFFFFTQPQVDRRRGKQLLTAKQTKRSRGKPTMDVS